jgi:hypothetical protein
MAQKIPHIPGQKKEPKSSGRWKGFFTLFSLCFDQLINCCVSF